MNVQISHAKMELPVSTSQEHIAVLVNLDTLESTVKQVNSCKNCYHISIIGTAFQG